MTTFWLLHNAFWETLYMLGISSLLATLIGLPIGIILAVTDKGGILANKLCFQTLGLVVNITRSVPFIILLVAIVPFTRLVIGTTIGTNAAIVPLTIGAAPFIARIVENALKEVAPGLIEAALSMGATPIQIIFKVLLPEAMAAIIDGLTVVIINLVGYTAMAGAVGGGGLGQVGINYGYQRFNPDIMLYTVILLVILVQLIQWGGNFFANRWRRN